MERAVYTRRHESGQEHLILDVDSEPIVVTAEWLVGRREPLRRH